MAKKRNAGSESEVNGLGAPPKRERRTRARHAAAPVTSAPATSAVSGGTAPAVDATADRKPEYEEIARLAYSFWEARGCEGGSPEEDWLRAEQELRGRRTMRAEA